VHPHNALTTLAALIGALARLITELFLAFKLEGVGRRIAVA
jgi:hypothetical protein